MQQKLNPTDLLKVKEVHAFILKDLKYHYGIPFLAEKFQIPEQKLKQGFREIYGAGVFETLTKSRMHWAASMLSTTARVGDIAKEIGYDHTTNFCASFKRHFGITPMEFSKLPELERESRIYAMHDK